jgi:hypothetical protein
MPEKDGIILTIQCGGSTFEAGPHDVARHRALLDCADAIGLVRDGVERVRVELGGLRRWIAFQRNVGGSPLYCIGYQETVGACWRGGLAIGGSNRKVIVRLHPDDTVTIVS